MNLHPLDSKALYALFGAAFDGTISEDNQNALALHLTSDAAARHLWFEFCDVECGLRELRRNVAPLEVVRDGRTGSSPHSVSRTKAKHVVEMWPGLLWAAAAVVVFGVSVFHSPVRSGTEPVLASFGEMHDVLWASPKDAFHPGDFVRVGQTLELLSGSVELKFRSGAAVTLRAPAIFQATSENEGFLKFGSLSARASAPRAKGFTVQTPTARIVDVGTEFVASAAADGQSHVEVKSGEVYVHLPWREDAKRLLGGETLSTENSLQRITVRMESGDGTDAFRLPSIDSPQAFEAAHIQKPSSFARLLGGEQQPDALLLSHEEAGRVFVDLGRSISVTKINAYSWGKGGFFDNDRGAAQNFELYGSDSSSVPKPNESLLEHGWELIGRVDSDHYFGKSVLANRPEQQACSFTSASGCLGRYRYLLCVPIRRTADLASVTPKACLSLFDVYSEPWTF